MSIDARVKEVVVTENGGGYLMLRDRPGDDGKPDGCAGQRTLSFDVPPPWVTQLAGKDIWGSSESIMYREQEIADRKGYTRIVFTATELHGLGPKAAADRLHAEQEVKSDAK